MTYRPGGPAAGCGPGGPPMPIGGDSDRSGVTVMLHHSMVELPDKPMQPRQLRRPRRLLHRLVRGLRQPQAGGRARPLHHPLAAGEEGPQGRGLRAQEADRLLHRPRGPGEVAPLDQEGHRGLAAGVREGRVQERHHRARSRPPRSEDPDWDAEDARYSSIRWLPSTIENAFGPHVHDPRTGEILEADIRVYHNILKLVRDWYFVQASPNDPRRRSCRCPTT